MKKVIVTAVILIAVFAGYTWVSSFQIQLSALEGKTEIIKRGDLVIPIVASGTVEPASRTEIKSKASGEVINIPFEEGDLVKQGDLLIELKPDDEQRSLDRAKSELAKAEANLAKAKTLHELQKKNNPVEVDIAKARKGMAHARLNRAQLDHEKLLTIQKEARPPLEVAFSQAALDEATANAKLSEGEVQAAENKKLSIQTAAEDVNLAQEAVTTAKTALADAEERFRETKIISPIDGMLTKSHVQIGMIIQSGKTSFTGGTVLMTISDVDKLYVIAEVDEADIGTVRELAPERARPGANLLAAGGAPNAGGNGVEHRIKEGRPVKISAEAFREESFEGVIDRILPEPQTRQAIISYDVRILLTSENRNKLFLGMQADVEFTAESIEDALLIPQDAIRIGPDGSHGVFVPVPSRDNPDEKEPKFVSVKLGVTDGFVTEVLGGNIKAGDEVYTIIPRNYSTGEEKGSDDEDDE